MAGDLDGTGDLVRDNATLLAGYLPLLEDEITEPTSPSGSVGMSPRPADAPLPGNAQAFDVHMVITEAVPRLEAAIRRAIAGHPGLRRGGSAGNFLKALESVVSLSGGLDEDGEAAAARILERLSDLARRLPDIDEAQRWRPVPSRACPYCGCFFLRVLEDARGQPAGRVECFGHTEAGPCRAAWAGLIEIASDVDGV
jgi:hypothetical protein